MDTRISRHCLPEGSPESRAHLGGKGYALARLADAGFPVPDFFVVAPAFYNASEIRKEPIQSAHFTAQETERIHQALGRIGGSTFAVRSSAVDEDGQQASFAGQLDSFLDVPVDQVAGRIRDVWLSIFSEHLKTYRQQNQLAETPQLPAVVVQRMIEPDAAGVAFSADITSGRWSVALVNAVRGLGEKLVSGECDAEGWHIHRDGRVLEWQPVGEPTEKILSEAQARKIAELARRCERFFGCPQDIEWAFEGRRLHLLQSRPITTLHRLPDPDGALNIWDNSNIAESYGGVTTPLTFSFAHYIYKEVYQQFCRIMHVPETVLADHRSIFNSMLGLIRGRVYYNLMSWYRMLALLPGFRFNRKFMEQMMGVQEGLPESVLAELDDRRLGARLKDAGRLAWALLGLVRAQWRVPGMIQCFYQHFDATLKSLPGPIEAMRLDELTAHFHTLEEQLLNRWDAPLVNDFFAMIYFGVLRSITEKWCHDSDGTLQNGLLCGTGQIISAEPAKRIHAMARIASTDTAWIALLCEGAVSDILHTMPRHEAFHAAYTSYLDRFADRCLNELKLESATLRDDPLPLLRSVGSLAQRIQEGHTPDTSVEASLRNASEAAVAERLSGKPFKKLVFSYVLKQARHRVRDRENLRFERTRLFGRIRSIFVECGKRLTALGALDRPEDVFYLEIYEVIGFVEGTTSTTNLRGLTALRRAEYARHAAAPPAADRFETSGVVNIGNRFESSTQPDPLTKNPATLQGIGCCPGVVRGRARVVTDPSNARMQRGEILVAEQTDPGWITLFPAAAGVLVERGSLLSHSAIVSREMGIPAIVSVKGLLQTIRTGDEIEFDGQSGKIRRIYTPDDD